MNHPHLRTVLAAVATLTLSASVCAAQANGARPTSTLGGPAPIADLGAGGGCITEGFDDILVLPGWFQQNNSSPIGTTGWFQGNDAVFPAHAGATTAYIGANFNNTAGAGTISNWLLTPELDLAAIDSLTFFTRTVTASTFPDRLEVRYSTAGASTNVGTLATDVGDFTNLALEINPTLAQGGYPDVWTGFTLDATDIAAAGTGRVAFRYFVTDAGPLGNNSDYFGIDSFEFCALAEADLSITKNCVVDGSGLIVDCQIDVFNNGPAAATNVEVVDTIPAGLTWSSDDCGAGPDVAGVLTWSVGALADQASATCNVTFDVDPAFVGQIDNTATVSADNADPNAADNSSTSSVTVGAPTNPLEIPTLSEWGLAAMLLALLGFGVFTMRRRRES